MKLLVFAHTPPPHHGQSYMVQLMLDGFGGDARARDANPPAISGIECYHVNARFSRSLEDVGEFQGAKIFLIFWFCLQAIWIRFRHGVKIFYYVPAPGKRVALYRDWLVMFMCRPFFKKIILHWHAAGLAKWLETSASITSRTITYRLFRPVDLSLVLSKYTVADAEKLLSRDIRIVNCGIPDPCPFFEKSILPQRRARSTARTKLIGGGQLQPFEIKNAGGAPHVFKVLFLAHCMREKGLFDAIEGVVQANTRLQEKNSPLCLHLTVAGEFVSAQEQSEFKERVAQVESAPGSRTRINYLGFVSGERKIQAFAESDCFCFPTYYHAESFGLVVVEAMAFGLPVVSTRWRSLPEILPPNYPGLVSIHSPSEVASALIEMATGKAGEALRENFINRFMLDSYLKALTAALHCIEEP